MIIPLSLNISLNFHDQKIRMRLTKYNVTLTVTQWWKDFKIQDPTIKM